MDNKMCIICRKTKDENLFNEEHIIPESLGNKKLKLNCVCKECNEKLGSKVDAGLTNNFLTELYRFGDKIKGKSGKLPNPFKKGLDENGRVIYCDENLKSSIQPNIEYDEKLSEISVNASSIEEGIKLANKKLKRLGKSSLSDEQIKDIYKNSKTTSYRPQIKMSASIDLYKLEMAIIKIAYEFMYYIIGDEYLKDDQGKKLSEMLKSYIYDNKKNALDGVIGTLSSNKQKTLQLFKKLGNQVFQNQNIHFICMCRSQNKIIVQITLFSSLSYAAVVSNNIYNIANAGIVLNPKNGEIIKI